MGALRELERVIWFDIEVRAGRRPNTTSLRDEFGFSESTARRLIAFFRDHLNAPLEYDTRRKGFYYADESFRLPVLQPRQEEMLAILLARNLLAPAAGGLISREIDRFGRRLLRVTAPLGLSPETVAERFSAQWHGHSPARESVFSVVSTALLEHRLLRFAYTTPRPGATSTRREAEPHHLQHYLGNWMLLAWCRLRGAWRWFHLARMQDLAAAETFTPRPRAEWADLLDTSFGIFQGGTETSVLLRFAPERAPRIREQTWHRREEKRDLPDGSLELRLPVTDLREIRLKVLQFGAEVEVLAPDELRRDIAEEAARMLGVYTPK